MNDNSFTRLVERLRDHEPCLFPMGIWNESLDRDIAELVTSGMAEDKSKFDLAYGMAVKSGLHIWNDSLHRSHIISQDVLTPTGSYWHGIMHRMEGDYDKAKRWFESAGSHPVMERLQAFKYEVLRKDDWYHVGCGELQMNLRQFYLQRSWDPYLFIDMVQGTVTSGHEIHMEKALSDLQKQEIIMLLEYSYRNACGGQIVEPFNR